MLVKKAEPIIIEGIEFEFGVIDGKVTLIDECLTPDSSRFWPADSYEEGKVQPSYREAYEIITGEAFVPMKNE